MGQGNHWWKLIRYIPGLSNVSRQGKIFDIVVKEKMHTQHQHIAIKKTLEFTTELAANIQTGVVCVLFCQCK